MDIQRINRGLSNDNYRALTSHGNKVFIKIFRLASKSTIDRECKLTEYLAHAGIAVPEIVKTKSGASCTTINGSILTIYEYLDGSHPTANANDALKIGSLAASIHRLRVPHYIQPGNRTSHSALKNQISHQITRIPACEKQLLSRAITQCQAVTTSLAPKGLIHSDLFLDNLIQTSNAIIYLLDFEETAFDCFLLDIGRALLGCCSYEGCVDFEIVQHLLQGYTQIRKLSLQEWNELYEWLIFSILLSITWRYTEFNLNRPEEGRQKIYRAFLPSLEAVLDLGKNDFLDQVSCNNTAIPENSGNSD